MYFSVLLYRPWRHYFYYRPWRQYFYYRPWRKYLYYRLWRQYFYYRPWRQYFYYRPWRQYFYYRPWRQYFYYRPHKTWSDLWKVCGGFFQGFSLSSINSLFRGDVTSSNNNELAIFRRWKSNSKWQMFHRLNDKGDNSLTEIPGCPEKRINLTATK